MSKVDGYIPIWYEYMIPYKKYSNCKNIIRIPINPYQFEYKPNILKDGKVVFYHGKTRQLEYIIKMLKHNDWLVSFDGLGNETGLSKAKELGVRYVQKSDLEEYMKEEELREFLLKKGGISDVI